MDDFDFDVRRHVYGTFARAGRAPSAAETAASLAVPVSDAEAAYRRLHEAHALVLHPGTVEIWMVNPFSAVPTPHRVSGRGRWWYGNCAWDALAILGAFHTDGRVESECADCGEPVALEVRDGEVAEGTDLLVHILVPARHWWDDIGFT